MGDAMPVDEIIAEPDEPGLIISTFQSVTTVISSNGWYIVALGALAYYIYKNYIEPNSRISPNSNTSQRSAEASAPQIAKDEARREAVLKLQLKYQKEAEERAEKLKVLEEKKKKERLEELARLEAMRGGQRLGESSTKKSFRPEYNPLMGDTSHRTCDRPARGRQGG